MKKNNFSKIFALVVAIAFVITAIAVPMTFSVAA